MPPLAVGTPLPAEALRPYPGFSDFDGAMVRENYPKSPICPSCPNLCPQEKRKD